MTERPRSAGPFVVEAMAVARMERQRDPGTMVQIARPSPPPSSIFCDRGRRPRGNKIKRRETRVRWGGLLGCFPHFALALDVGDVLEQTYPESNRLGSSMSAIADTARDDATGDRLARRNALVLAVAQALAGANNTVLIATGGLVGALLAPERGLATVPITVYVAGLWMGTLPVGMLAQRFGR